MCLHTATTPTAIQLSTDKSTLQGDGYDVAHIVTQLLDAPGQTPFNIWIEKIAFTVQGQCRVLGVDNGATDSVQAYQAERVTTSQGRALLILQAEREAGHITVQATGDGFE